MNNRLIIIFFLISVSIFSQTKVKDTTIRRAKINYLIDKNLVRFKSENPALIPISGAPKPSYSHFWEMGDGHYSRESEPKHIYKSKGNYNARVAVTNNYDNGKPPVTRPKLVAVNETSNEIYNEVASIEAFNGLNIIKNCDPIPDQEIVVTISYQNLENYVANGRLYLFYNEKQFKTKNFDLLEFRKHNGEREITENLSVACIDVDESNSYLANKNSFVENKKYCKTSTEENLDATLLEANKTYLNSTVFEMDDFDSKETRNLFFTFKTKPEMIKDTSATVTMRSVFVPNRNYKNHKIKNLEMQIVTSHDPNKMSSTGQLLNYRLVRFKSVNFKTQFQNNGEGPARMIRLETDIPKMFDKKTFIIEDMYPKCPICPKGETPTESCLDTIIKQNQIHFTFKNIYLPGTTQKNVKEKDSTKGFVKYSMKFNKDFHKIKTKSRTLIFFDKNEPIATNYATTRFMSGFSVGARTGYNLFSKLENAKSYFVGATVSPFKSYKLYWQSELYFNNLQSRSNSFTEEKNIRLERPELINGVDIQFINIKITTESSRRRNTAELVPISLRYNLNSFIGVGIGPQFSIIVNEIETLDIQKRVFSNNEKLNTTNLGQGIEILKFNKNDRLENRIEAFKEIQPNFFADITVGFARIGPSLGTRYVLNTKTNNLSHIQFYGIWKF